jgi:hypothetical protein
MKTIDFSQPGGFPLTQDQLDYLQTAYKEALAGIAGIAGAGPLMISGGVITKTLVGGTTYNYAITAGWLFWNGELIKVAAGGLLGIDESVDALYFQLNRTSNPLTYNDGSTPDVIDDVQASFVSQAIGTADDATHFLVTELQPIGREAFPGTAIVVGTAPGYGTITGWIIYTKNLLNNTLQIKVSLATASPSDFNATPAVTTPILATLPVGYRPLHQRAPFILTVGITGDRIKDDKGGYFKHLTGCIDTSGRFEVDWILPDAGVSTYGVEGNLIIPLD